MKSEHHSKRHIFCRIHLPFLKVVKRRQDYHGMFDHKYFVGWMEKLFQCLDKEGISNAPIIMENARYHKVLGEAVATHQAKC